jgi:hypothetical protein
MSMRNGPFEYDVCLSFAGEQRQYVQRVADGLRQRNIRVFYDGYETVTLWGKDLYEHLDWIYQRAARFCVLFASADYANKVWTSHERRSAQARALEEREEYILPVCFDDTQIPGVRKTIAYVDLRTTTIDELVSLIAEKVRTEQQQNTSSLVHLHGERRGHLLDTRSDVGNENEPRGIAPRPVQSRYSLRAKQIGRAIALSAGYICAPFFVVFFVVNGGHASAPMHGFWQGILSVMCFVWLVSSFKVVPLIFRRIL